MKYFKCFGVYSEQMKILKEYEISYSYHMKHSNSLMCFAIDENQPNFGDFIDLCRPNEISEKKYLALATIADYNDVVTW